MRLLVVYLALKEKSIRTLFRVRVSLHVLNHSLPGINAASSICSHANILLENFEGIICVIPKLSVSFYTVACESDCSASTAAIVKGAGYRLNNAKLKAVSIYLTTRNMRAAMKAAGAKVLTDSKYLTSGDYLKAGDILLNDNHHVAIAVTSGAKVSTPSTTLTGTFQTRLPILRKGSSGTAVAMLQAMLGDLRRIVVACL